MNKLIKYLAEKNIHSIESIEMRFREAEDISKELTQLIDTANAPIFGVDIAGEVNEWNQKVEHITGFTKDEVVNRDLVQTLITDDFKKSVQEVLNKALRGEETSNYEVPLYTKSGEASHDSAERHYQKESSRKSCWCSRGWAGYY